MMSSVDPVPLTISTFDRQRSPPDVSSVVLQHRQFARHFHFMTNTEIMLLNITFPQVSSSFLRMATEFNKIDPVAVMRTKTKPLLLDDISK